MIDTIKQNPIPAALAGLSLYWLYRNRPAGQTQHGTGSSWGQTSGAYRTPGSYQGGRTTQASSVRTGYASREERDAMVVNAARQPTASAAYREVGVQHDDDEGLIGSAGRMASSAGQMVSGAASTAGDMASSAASSAGHLVSNAGDTAIDAGSGILELIQRNPVPAALVGLGLSWLWMNRSSGQPDYRAHSGTHYRYGPQAVPQTSGSGYRATTDSDDEGLLDRATERVGEIASSAQERVSDMAGAVQEHVGDMAGSVMHRTRRAPGQLERMIEENPLMSAAVAASLGAAVGLWLPLTETENQLMGKAHDQAMDKVQQVASETMDKVEDVAQEVRATVRDEARAKGLTV